MMAAGECSQTDGVRVELKNEESCENSAVVLVLVWMFRLQCCRCVHALVRVLVFVKDVALMMVLCLWVSVLDAVCYNVLQGVLCCFTSASWHGQWYKSGHMLQ